MRELLRRYYSKRRAAGFVIIVGLFLVILIGPSIYTKLSTSKSRYNANTINLQSVPQSSTAIVFGAGVLPDGEPTEYLYNRVQTAVSLYKAGRVSKLLVTGDNSSKHYDEPTAMRQLAVKLGVPDKNIIVDYAGLSTYDSCYRAARIFHISLATVVTQGYHLPRAVTLCRGLGIKTIGLAAKHDGHDFTVSYILRELIATDKALLFLSFKPQPTVL